MKRVILLLMGMVCLELSAQTLTDSPPIVLNKQSNVVIKNLRIITTSGNGIELWNCNNITIENCEIESKGNGVNIERGVGITIRNCFFKRNQGGVYAYISQAVVVENCKFFNIQGPVPRGQFVQFNGVTGAGNRISCNYGENILGESNAEDAINLFGSQGTAASPILVENNYIKGGGPSPSGGGIMLGDGSGAYQKASGNVVINPGQYGMAIAGGNDIEVSNNKVYGKKQSFTNVGIYIWNQYASACTNNKILNNHAYWIQYNGYAASFWNGGNCSNSLISGNVWNSTQVSETMPPPSCAGLTTVAPNQSPIANAGADKTIQLPTSSISLTGSGSDPDGSIMGYSWTQVSGPNTGAIGTPGGATTSISALIAGTYVFRLTVTDDKGAKGSDDVQVIVNAIAPISNQPPIANAGADKSITLPTNTINLTGSGTDPDGTVASYAWSKISGPANGTIQSPNSASTNMNNLVEGAYIFRLTVTDNEAVKATDDVQVTVNSAPNQAPSASAGNDQTITLPTSSVTLTGSGTDPDGSIASYDWSKVSGPGGESIQAATSASTKIDGLVQGIYTFRLTVTDNAGSKATDDVQIAVNTAPNQVPSANAGADQTIQLPTASVSLTGSGSDPDGSIMGYSWTQISGPNTATIGTPGGASTNVNALIAGTYIFRLTLTDDKGAKGSDDVQVTVNAATPPPNQAPLANAGADQTITLPASSVTLNGSGTDADGSIASYAWSKISGPAGESIESTGAASTNISGMAQGVYVFRLTATDDKGATATDDVQITVNAAPPPPPPAPNQAPAANAGTDQTITLPSSSVTLNGSGTDADGSIASYAWSKISGPVGESIESTGAASTKINSLVQGTYVFRLTVTDNSGAIATDDVQVTVNAAPPTPAPAPPAPNQAPVANAGTDQTITLPASSVTLNGNGTDADGSIASFSWSKLSGPAGGSIQSAGAASTNISGLIQGVYVFRLTVTDDKGASATDDLQVTVNAAPPPPPPAPAPNKAPVASAGPDQTITLPASSVTLTGSGTDADGNIVSYAWSKVSGPAGGTIQSGAAASTNVTGLAQGVYVFRLKVTDDKGAAATDDIQVTVNAAPPPPPAPNKAPTANAGADISITLPENKANLDGRNSSDADGQITSWKWVRVKGTPNASITNANTATASVSGLTKGLYEFELSITDDKGATSKDLVAVTVIKINKKPVAQAKDTVAVLLPVQSAVLDGSASYDPDGNIQTYSWTYLNGPVAPRILSPDKSKSVVTNLASGAYDFELSVTDDDGEVAKASVHVIVKHSSSRRLVPIVNLYPNPATSNATFTIETEAVGRSTITFYDFNGNPVLSETFIKTDPSFNKTVNVSKLPKGTYTAVISVDVEEKVVKKLIRL